MKMELFWLVMMALLAVLTSCHAVSRGGTFMHPDDVVREDCRRYLAALDRVAELESQRAMNNRLVKEKAISNEERIARNRRIQGLLRDARSAQSRYYAALTRHRRNGAAAIVDEELGGRTLCEPDNQIF